MGKLSPAIILFIVFIDIDPSEGHGYMLDPLSRSAVSHPRYQTNHPCNSGQVNWTPQGNYCGGREVRSLSLSLSLSLSQTLDISRLINYSRKTRFYNYLILYHTSPTYNDPE